MSVRARRIALWGTLAVLLAAGMLYAFRPQPVPVDFAVAERGTLTVTVDEEGMTRVRDVFVLSAPVTGRVRRIEAEVGDPVESGETVLARIEPIDPTLLDVRSESEAQAAVRAAEAARDLARAEVDRAEADLEFARSELDRYRRLGERGVASEQQLDAARRQYRTARAARETARAALQERIFQLDRARARLVSPTEPRVRGEDCPCIPVRAPVSGRVLQVVRESEGPVQAGEPLVHIGDPSELEVVVDLLSADAVKVEAGQRVILEEWGGSAPLSGVVRRVEPYGFTKISALGIEEQRVNVIVDFTDPREEWDRLGHGYRVEARIVLFEDEDVLKLPLSALFRNGREWAVFVEEEGRARMRPVERGRHTGLEAAIESGLDPGDRVVLHPSNRVRDGVPLTARD